MTTCQVCYAVLPAYERAMSFHEQWHNNVSRVAIESTKRIEALERRVAELLDERRSD